MKQSLATHEIPTPKLLIKHQKTINGKGEFPTSLVIPATNFTVTFSKLIYLDKAKVNY